MTYRHTTYAGLAATERPGAEPEAPAVVLLHGHGGSPPFAARGLAAVVDAVHAAVAEAAMDAPIVVGHSIGGPIASIYASVHPTTGIVTVEAPIRLEPFAEM